ncbi:hypothetical protein MKW92_016613 [Papaver armeniacum]|nr:hypothetical protein MKW92_016613 [Papaver armeniacum]
MENLSVGKMDNNVPPVKPQCGLPVFMYKRDNVFDVRSKFVSRIKISAKKLYEQLKTYEDQKPPGEFDILNVSLSNNEISISSLVTSLVNFSSDQLMEVLVQTNEAITFGVDHKTFMRLLRIMALGKEVHPILLAYQPGEDKLILKDRQGETHFTTVPCTPKEINESLLNLKLNN